MGYGIQELEKILDSCLNLAWIKDKENKLIYVNQAYLDVFDTKREDVIGKTEEQVCGGRLGQGELILGGEKCYFEVNEIDLGDTDEGVGKMGVACEVTLETTLHSTIENIIVKELAKMHPHIQYDAEVINEALEVWEHYFLYETSPIGKQIFVCSGQQDKAEVALQGGICLAWQPEECEAVEAYVNACINSPSNHNRSRVSIVAELPESAYKMFLRSKGIEGVITCMIPFGQENVGLVQLYFNEGKRVWLEATVPYIREITKNLGVLLKNTMLFKKVTTQLKNMESKRLQLESYFELTTDCIAIVDESSLKLTPLTKSWSARRSHTFNMTDRIVARELIAACNQAKATERTSEVEMVYEEKEQLIILWQMRYIPQQQQFLMVGRDITARKTLAAKKRSLEIQMEKEKVNRELLRHMSKWFEKPIRYIKEDLKHLEAMELAYGQEYVQMIRSNTGRIQKMLGYILANSRERYSEEQVQYSLCDVVQEVQNIVESMDVYVKSNNKELEVISEVGALILSLDAEKLEHIMINLISNALKYTKEGGRIIVYLAVEEEEIRLHVMDNGEGIQAQRIDTIFERFSGKGAGEIPKKEGSGIGLSTVKKFVELHGGVVEARSEWGIGTEVIVRLPRDLTKAIPAQKCDTTLSDTYINVYGGRKYGGVY